MKNSWKTPARKYAKGIGDAVADRTINRKLPGGGRETWEDVALRVALGSASLAHAATQQGEFESMHHHLRQASVLMSGRHLQHGDKDQATRNQEVFTNCSTAASSLLLFYLLLNGSGVGRAYDDDMMVVNWAKNLPHVVPFIAPSHPDVLSGEISADYTTLEGRAGGDAAEMIYYNVPDNREGWAKAIEQIEFTAWEGKSADVYLVLDFSDVRPRGAPIGGMQGRPASGPGPLMRTVRSIAALKGEPMDAWESTLHVDHHLADCVRVGGARRAARMATKTWRDPSIFRFINVKQGGRVLWSSNNSVTVDQEFWNAVKKVEKLLNLRDFKGKGVTVDTLRSALVGYTDRHVTDLELHAYRVFEAACRASYFDETGEPGFINVDMLTQKDKGVETLFDGDYAHSARFQLDERSLQMTAQIAKVFSQKQYTQITNPCGEITIAMVGGYCVIADVVPFHAGTDIPGTMYPASLDARLLRWDTDAEDAFRTATRALIRTNTMDCLYGKEVRRTNRIGVGITGLHEYAWARFGYGWKDIVDEQKSLDFWQLMARFSRACVAEAAAYSAQLGLAMPHTVTTIKPAGTTSKLFDLTEGAHLPAMREYLRWVQFRSDDPLVNEYRAKGYPVRDDLKTYSGTSIVGFPTAPQICTLGMGDKLVTASEATPEEQYEYLRLMEKYWIDGFDGETRHDSGNQVSYTLKYEPGRVSFDEFRRTLLDGQSTIKCCSVMPKTDATAYEYQPEQPVTPEEFQALLVNIAGANMKEDVGLEHVDCGGGACPISFNENEVAEQKIA